MGTRNFETREGFDFWDRLCKITRYAFLLSKAGNSVQKAEGLGNWIDRDEAMVVMDDAQSEINVLRQDCATMIAELEDLRAKGSQVAEGVVVSRELLVELSNQPFLGAKHRKRIDALLAKSEGGSHEL